MQVESAIVGNDWLPPAMRWSGTLPLHFRFSLAGFKQVIPSTARSLSAGALAEILTRSEEAMKESKKEVKTTR